MSIVKHKLFWTWNYDKKEKWINKMASKGLHLSKVNFCRFEFEKGDIGEYEYILVFNDDESIEKKDLEYICRSNKWIYYKRKIKDNSIDISVNENKLSSYLKKIQIILIAFMLLIVLTGSNSVGNLFNIIVKHNYDILSMGIGFIFIICYVIAFIGFINIFRKIHFMNKKRNVVKV